MSINQVSITGNLTRDPELRATQGGTPVLSFGIAVNDRRKNAAGQWEDVPNFFECVTFGNRPEAFQGGHHRQRNRADAEPQAAAGAAAAVPADRRPPGRLRRRHPVLVYVLVYFSLRFSLIGGALQSVPPPYLGGGDAG